MKRRFDFGNFKSKPNILKPMTELDFNNEFNSEFSNKPNTNNIEVDINKNKNTYISKNNDIKLPELSFVTHRKNFTNTGFNLFFDMDGVLFNYDRQMYQPQENNVCLPEAPINQAGAHVFANVTPCKIMVDTFNVLHQMMIEGYDLSVHVLSAVNISPIMCEHIIDKLNAIKLICPNITGQYVHIVPSGDKAIYMQELLGRPLTKQDINFDDFWKVCTTIKNAGGTAVQVLNPENHAKSDFYILDTKNKNYIDVVHDIFNIMSDIKQKTE